MNSNIEVRKELSITASSNFASICSNILAIKDSLNNLKELIEAHYNVEFNFDDTFLDFPLFKNEGKYSDLKF